MPTNAQSRVVWRVGGENVRALASGGLAADDFQGLGASSAMYSSSPKGGPAVGQRQEPSAPWRSGGARSGPSVWVPKTRSHRNLVLVDQAAKRMCLIPA